MTLLFTLILAIGITLVATAPFSCGSGCTETACTDFTGSSQSCNCGLYCADKTVCCPPCPPCGTVVTVVFWLQVGAKLPVSCRNFSNHRRCVAVSNAMRFCLLLFGAARSSPSRRRCKRRGAYAHLMLRRALLIINAPRVATH